MRPSEQPAQPHAGRGPGREAAQGGGAGGSAPAADPRSRLGRRGEDLACELLERAGLRGVARDWRGRGGGGGGVGARPRALGGGGGKTPPRCREGEIDVVATGPGLLVVCEVKTRRGDGFGSAAAAVTWSKQRRLRRLAAAYLAGAGLPSVDVRFDVVAVTWPRGRAPVAEHL